MRRTATLLTFLAAAAPAAGHHTGTPPIVRLTLSGDTTLPRAPAFGDTLAFAPDSGPNIYSLHLFSRPTILMLVSAGGNSANPSAAIARSVAFDSDGNPLGSNDPGRQIFVRDGGLLEQLTHDPSGTSANPAVNLRGNRVGFESAGNLAGQNGSGALQVYFQDGDGSVVQLSRGQGTSRNVSLSRSGGTIAFESTSDRVTGLDTGVSQIWLSTMDPTTSHPITAGCGPSRNPSVSDEGRFVVFESDADLAMGGADTGVPQVFAYDTRTGDYAQVTQEPDGCTAPMSRRHGGDFRVVFTCGSEGVRQGFYHYLRADRRYRLPISEGDTNRAVTGMGYYFVAVSTTADLIAGTGTTSGHQLYMLNLYKRPAQLVSGNAIWFPERGLRPLH